MLFQQNTLIQKQNLKLDIQSHLIEAQRRAGLMFEFTSILEEIDNIRKNKAPNDIDFFIQSVNEAVGQKTPSSLENQILEQHRKDISQFEALYIPNEEDSTYRTYMNSVLEIRRERLKELQNKENLKVALKEFQLKGEKAIISLTGKLQVEPIYLPGAIIGRIAALSLSLKPYRYLNISGIQKADTDEEIIPISNESSLLVDNALSPERGQLLQTLIRSEVYFVDVIKAGVDFSYADLRYSQFENTNLNLEDGGLGEGVKLQGCDLSDSDFLQANLSYADLSYANMTRVQAAFSDLSTTRLIYANLNRIVLTHASLKGASLAGAILTNANLSYTNFEGANLSDCDLRGSYLTDKFSGADLTDANLNGALVPISEEGEESWLEKMKNLPDPIIGFDPDDWRISFELVSKSFMFSDDVEVAVLRKK